MEREWCEIEDSMSGGVFFKRKRVRGYIPRDVLENELGIDMSGRYTWFSREQSEVMHAHPEWRTELPE